MKTLALLLLPAAVAPLLAANWYVRPDGGTRNQCTGLADAAYPGSGSGQACAFSHPFYLVTNNATTSPTWEWIIAAGDTVVIKNHASGAKAQYRMGQSFGGNGITWNYCTLVGTQQCVMPRLPSGLSASERTRFVGEGAIAGGDPATSWTPLNSNPELFGVRDAFWLVSNFTFSDKSTSQFIEIGYLDLTDHEQCAGVAPATTVCSSAFPNGDHARRGLNLQGFKDSYLHDINTHGFSVQGLIGGKWSGVNTVERVRVAGNYHSGWDMDSGPTLGVGAYFAGSGNTGVIHATDVMIEWNGCNESYPAGSSPTYSLCVDERDGFTTTVDAAEWYVTRWTVRYNTSDGFDGLYFGAAPLTNVGTNLPSACENSYTAANGCTSGWIFETRQAYPPGTYPNNSLVIIQDSQFYGNMGNQVKLGGTNNSTIRNSLIIGNCDFWNGAATVVPASNPNLVLANLLDPADTASYCRAAGPAAVMGIRPGHVATFEQNTVITVSSYALDIWCASASGFGYGWGDCKNSGPEATSAIVRNNILHSPYNCTGGECQNPFTLAIHSYAGATGPDNSTPLTSKPGGSRANNLMWGFTHLPDPVCGGAGTAGEICSVSAPVFAGIANLVNADLRLILGSPAIDAGADTGIGADIAGTGRPQNSAYDIGAFEFLLEAPPPTPPGLEATALSTDSVDISWIDPDGSETAFHLERSIGSAGPWTPLASFDAGVTSFSDTGLSEETNYCYRIGSSNSFGSSPFSAPACAVTPEQEVIEFAVEQTLDNAALLLVRRSTSAGCVVNWNGVFPVSPGLRVFSFLRTGLTPGTDYSFTITCGAVSIPGTIRTRPSITAAARNLSFRYQPPASLGATRVILRYGTSPANLDQSVETPCSSGCLAVLPLSAGSVYYVRHEYWDTSARKAEGQVRPLLVP